MPYRIDLDNPPGDAFETLVDLGALDVDRVTGGLAAIMPDAVPASAIQQALGVRTLRVSAAVGRDDDSVWTLSPRVVRVGSLTVVPAGTQAPSDALQVIDGAAFGTGLHPTTVLCLQAIEELFTAAIPDRVLDVGTGSGILALAALRTGASSAVGVDIDPGALTVAAENARLNDAAGRLRLVCGGPDAVRDRWPLVMANIRPAELMAMAPAIVRRVASRGTVLLSGVPRSVAVEVEQVYRRLGMTGASVTERGGWTALVLHASW